MAKNGARGGGRKGAVRDRFQAYNPKIERWVKYDATSGRIMDVKSGPSPFKGVTKHD